MKELEREKWSETLLKIKPEVKNIFYKGNVDLLLDKAPKLAIVGSRRMTEYGQKIIEKWMPILVEKKITIISGFMYGVDQTAHKSCIENGGRTICVLGWGIDWPVAAVDEDLYKKVIEVDSLIVSEYPEKTVPELWMFPQRNRIVAGIADAVLVVEGAKRSGSLITAHLATQFGKKLLAVPGPVTSRVAEGTNQLIRDGEARAVTSEEEVLQEMNLGKGQMSLQIPAVEDPVLSLLSDSEHSVDELARILKLSVPEVLTKLTKLILSGLVYESGGVYRVI